MLNPNNDRLDYGQLLSAPDKYQLDFAIGTTYSLDLDALVGVSLALGLSESTDSEFARNPVALLEALRVTAEKVALFCEAGQIYMPSKVTPLYVLLERMVYQVKTAKSKMLGGYPSFHPKVWLIRYVDEKNEPLYRILVLSRNLTFDRSWDVSFCMDGVKTTEETSKNDPIKDFLAYLLGFAEKAPAKKKKIRQICQELSHVHFDIGSQGFYDFDFIPVGLPKAAAAFRPLQEYPLFASTFNELFIMSPFLSNSVIESFNDDTRGLSGAERVLVTRAAALSKLKPKNCDRFRVYTVKDSVIDGETLVSQEENSIQKQDIHAKVFMYRKYSETELYLGSLNASYRALHGNIEFVVRLRAKNRYLNLKRLTDSLFCGEENGQANPFVRADVSTFQNGETEADRLLSAVIKDITRLKAVAHVLLNEDTYSIRITFNKTVTDCDVVLSPLFVNRFERMDREVLFTDLSLMQLSEFYKVTVSCGESALTRIVMIPTEGLPEEREKAVISSVVKDDRCFYQYISFLLGDVGLFGGAELPEKVLSRSFSASRNSVSSPALYEKMLRTAAEEPEKFKEIDCLLKALAGEGIVPAQFEKMYKIFRRAVGYRD